MKITSTRFTESAVGTFAFHNRESNFNLQTVNSSEPDEADNDEEEDEEEERGNDSDGGDPELDGTVVHSPVMPQPGGKPRQ